jgi:hypothetical protein
MKRFLLVTLTLLSCLLCAAFGVLWARSPNHCDYASKVTATRHYVGVTFPGGVKLSTWPAPVEPPSGFKFETYEYGARNAQGVWMDHPAVSWSKLGFDFKPLRFTNQPSAARGAFEVFVPFWFLVGLTLLPPIGAWVNSMVRRSRLAQFRCSRCGYDLRTLPMGVETCPCGGRE